jgi:peroxiredoxin
VRGRGVRRLLLAAIAAAALGTGAALATLAIGSRDTVMDVSTPPGTVDQGAFPRPPARLPALALRDIDGRPLQLGSRRRGAVVVNVFGSWCEPCRQEAAGLARVARRFARRASVVGVAEEDRPQAMRRFARRYGWTWPLVDDAHRRIWHALGTAVTPTTYVASGDGRIVGAIFGRTTEPRLTALLRRAIA